MAKVDDNVREAYENVRNGGARWLVLGYDASVKNKINLEAQGNDHGEMLTHLKDDKNQYVYFRVDFTADDETKRTKFVFASWGGANSPRLQKAQMSVHASSILDIIREFALI